MIDVDDTIAAIASPATPAPRGIVRLSGPDVMAILAKLQAFDATPTSASRSIASIDLGNPLGSIDAEVMAWPTSRSYTGQPSAEIHTIGSPPVLESLVLRLIEAGARAARPGEFTMRAFLAGRLDLTQAEAVLGVIEADDRGSLDHALGQLAGNLSRPLHEMRDLLLDLLADVEAGLDFVDEDIEFISDETLVSRLREILERLEETSQKLKSRSGGAKRVTVALRGRPNAGKSRLVNAISESDAAIVADMAGTTRDMVTVEFERRGHAIRLVDTAGIEEARSEIDHLSQQQGEKASTHADIRLWCVDHSNSIAQSDRAAVMSRARSDSNSIDIWVATKCDLHPADAPEGWIATSAQTGEGIDAIGEAICDAIEARDRQESGSVAGTAARAGQSLSRGSDAIRTAIELTLSQQGHEFIAAELRIAVDCLGEVTGTVYTDDILDRVFGRFCIGK